MIIIIITSTLGTVTKGLIQGLEGLEIRSESWRLEETCCHSISSEKKNSQAVNNNNYYN